jgi:mono/diheme cytochrome c family protein
MTNLAGRCAFAVLSLAGAASAADRKVEYNRDVRPILAENCFACHGADSAARKGDLRLDLSDAAKKDAIVPHKPDESPFVARIFSDEDSEMMPPPKTKKKLTAAQKEVLQRWIAQGAEYQAHWSLIAPTRPPLPQVNDAKWVKTPIDRFILKGIENAKLSPAPEADRRTLARKAALDFTGLPPDPAEVDRFLADSSPDAYENYLDRLLASPHWGEHRARYWLDAARYADTHGIHFDNFREIWAYRDWVINAFNANQRFDRFGVEQLAGDLLPNPTLEQRIATGFQRCNITTNEGGVIAEEYKVLYARDRTETTGAVFMGLTVGCAVCHDHKYDPISMREFYSMSAFFNNTTQEVMDGNVKDTPPVVPVPRKEDRAQWDLVKKKIDAQNAVLAKMKTDKTPAFEKWLAGVKPSQIADLSPDDGLKLFAWLNEGAGKLLHTIQNGKPRSVDVPAQASWANTSFGSKGLQLKAGNPVVFEGVGDFERNQAFSYGAWVRVGRPAQNGGLIAKMDESKDHVGWDLYVDRERFVVHLVHKWPDNAIRAMTINTFDTRQWRHVVVSYDGSSKASGVKIFVDGQLQPLTVSNDTLTGTIKNSVPVKLGQRHQGQRLDGTAIAEVRVYDRAVNDAEAAKLASIPKVLGALAQAADKRKPETKQYLLEWYLATLDPDYSRAVVESTNLRNEEARLRALGTIAHVMAEKPESPSAFVLFRGEYDKRRDPVTPAIPAALPAMPKDLPKNRLGLALWLFRPEHPLTARVTVNRFWQEMFGNGLVRTAGDFGVSGELPSHPELLDWLAVDFRESGWDVKRLFKMMAMSATYRQSAAASPEKLKADPDNKLLARGPRQRMDAEMIRDYALAVSGLLVRKLGGPSVRPYQPDGVWEAVAMPESNTSKYKRDDGENLYRRSMYTFWKRSAPPASMDIFNAPNRETCTVRRERTNTPLQALVTLNDVQFVEAARKLAERTLAETGDRDDRFQKLAARLLARPFAPEELKIVQQSLDALLVDYKAKPEEAKKLIAFGESKADPKRDPVELAAWTMLGNQLLNLDEVLTK